MVPESTRWYPRVPESTQGVAAQSYQYDSTPLIAQTNSKPWNALTCRGRAMPTRAVLLVGRRRRSRGQPQASASRMKDEGSKALQKEGAGRSTGRGSRTLFGSKSLRPSRRMISAPLSRDKRQWHWPVGDRDRLSGGAPLEDESDRLRFVRQQRVPRRCAGGAAQRPRPAIAQSRCRCGRGEPQSRCRCGRG